MNWPEDYIDKIVVGDCCHILRSVPDESVHCIVTSPPYWGLRDYGVEGQLGLENTPEEYTQKMVEVFREVRRVLRPDGTLWLNLGDSYANDGKWGGSSGGKNTASGSERIRTKSGLKHKDLVGMPWRLAFALQADGWYLRSDIIWSKPNPMPESVTDRPTKAHEYLFLMSKSERYYYDGDAIREPHAGPPPSGGISAEDYENQKWEKRSDGLARPPMTMKNRVYNSAGRNKRSVWTVATQPFSEAHFATFPLKLIEPCILAGTSEKGACSDCGKPWKRVVEKHLVPTSKAARTCVVDGRDIVADRNDQGSNRQKDGHMPGWCRQDKTLGWEKTCKHKDDAEPCIVLDPFGGAGTTALVAAKHGRRSVSIELNPEYAEMARKRIKNEQAQGKLF